MEPGEEAYELTGEIVAGEKYDGEAANISCLSSGLYGKEEREEGGFAQGFN